MGHLAWIYVAPAHRGQGFARALLARCEAWARVMGCAKFARDCELESDDSLAFHRCSDVAETNRITCFTKPLDKRHP